MLTDIKQSFDILSQIGKVSSTKEKQEILSHGDNNQVLKTLLSCAYNPFLQYNIKKIPILNGECQGESISEQRYSEFLNLLVKLNKREITGNAAINEVAAFLVSCTSDEYLWYTRVIQKDMKIGMADKGINKVFKNLIPVYEVLLADKIAPADLNLDTPKALKLLPERMVTQYKIDGYRLNICLTETGDVSIRTRNGKFVTGYHDLEMEALSKLPRGYVYDGEIVAPELFEWILKNSESESAVANRDLFSEVMSHAFSKEDNKQGIFNMFDMVPFSEWKTHKTTEPYEVRLDRMNNMVRPLDLVNIQVVPTSRVFYKSNPDDLAEIVDQFHQFLNVGWEGLMIKNLDSVYEFKRSKNLLKMKMMDTVDLPVIDVFEGTGKYEGMLGGAVVEYKGFQVGVGSGWNDSQRAYYWEHKNDLVGKTLEIAYQAETKNKNGGLSLSFPVVKTVRDDK